MAGFFWRGAPEGTVRYPTPAEQKLAAFMEGTQTCTCSCHMFTGLLGQEAPPWATRPLAVSPSTEAHGLAFHMAVYLCQECTDEVELGVGLGFIDWLERLTA